MNMNNHGHWANIWIRRRSATVSLGRSVGTFLLGIRPMECLINNRCTASILYNMWAVFARSCVGGVTPACIWIFHKFIDPSHLCAHILCHFNGATGVKVRIWIVREAVGPLRGGWKATRQHLLINLSQGNFGIGIFSMVVVQYRRNEQIGLELGYSIGIEPLLGVLATVIRLTPFIFVEL
jgi:hypothetical protein